MSGGHGLRNLLACGARRRGMRHDGRDATNNDGAHDAPGRERERGVGRGDLMAHDRERLCARGDSPRARPGQAGIDGRIDSPARHDPTPPL